MTGAREENGAAWSGPVSISTPITIFLIPLLYSKMARYTGSPLAVTRKLEAELKGREMEPAPAE